LEIQLLFTVITDGDATRNTDEITWEISIYI